MSTAPGFADRQADSAGLTDRTIELDPRSAIAWANRLDNTYRTAGADQFRVQFAKAMQLFEGDADGLNTLSLAANAEFPYESYQIAVAMKRADGNHAAALHLSLGPLIALGQYDESLNRIAKLQASPGDVHPLMIRPFELLALGLKGDYERLNTELVNPVADAVAPQFRFAGRGVW